MASYSRWRRGNTHWDELRDEKRFGNRPAGLAPSAELLLAHMTEWVSLANQTGCIVYTNAAEDAMFGNETGELLGQHVSVQNAYPDNQNQRIVEEVIRSQADS